MRTIETASRSRMNVIQLTVTRETASWLAGNGEQGGNGMGGEGRTFVIAACFSSRLGPYLQTREGNEMRAVIITRHCNRLRALREVWTSCLAERWQLLEYVWRRIIVCCTYPS